MNEIFPASTLKSSLHPDFEWLRQTKGWELAGTLTFANRQHTINHGLLKNFFALYNFHVNGEYNWKNVPVYWRWEADDNERLHCHFAILAHTPEFHWLQGSGHTFAGVNELIDWMRTNWRHGKSEYAIIRNNGWLAYIAKENSVMDSCFSPPIHFLKRMVKSGRDGCYFPWMYRNAEAAA